jgi:hypothetical protein
MFFEYFGRGSYRTTLHSGFNVADNAARILPNLIHSTASVGYCKGMQRSDPQTVKELRAQIKAAVGVTDGNMTAGTFQCYVLRLQTNIYPRD